MKYIFLVLFLILGGFILLPQPTICPPLMPPLAPQDPDNFQDYRDKFYAVYQLLDRSKPDGENHQKAMEWLDKAQDWPPPSSFCARYLLTVKSVDHLKAPIILQLAEELEKAPEEHLDYMKNFFNFTSFMPEIQDILSMNQGKKAIISGYDRIFFACRAYKPGWDFLRMIRARDEELVDPDMIEKYSIHSKTGMITQ